MRTIATARAHVIAQLAGAGLGTALLLSAAVATALQQTVTVGPGETASVDSITVVNGTDQPANVALSDGTLDVAVPIQFGVVVAGADCAAVVPASNFARCKVSPGARLVLSLGERTAPPAQPPPPAEQTFPQPPASLARSGVGGSWDQPPPPALLAGETLAVVILLAAAGLALRRSVRARS